MLSWYCRRRRKIKIVFFVERGFLDIVRKCFTKQVLLKIIKIRNKAPVLESLFDKVQTSIPSILL